MSREVFMLQMQALQTKRIWSVIAGPSTGSRLSIAAGGKRRRAKPLRNPNLSDDDRHFEGELGLYIECAWRLETSSHVLCASGAPELDPETMVELGRMRTTTIAAVEMSIPSLDFALRFADGCVFRVFCDQIDEQRESDNYTLFIPGRYFTVGSRSILRVSECAENDGLRLV